MGKIAEIVTEITRRAYDNHPFKLGNGDILSAEAAIKKWFLKEIIPQKNPAVYKGQTWNECIAEIRRRLAEIIDRTHD